MASDISLFALGSAMIMTYQVCAESLAKPTHPDLSMSSQSLIQQPLIASSQVQSAEHFGGFTMASDIGLFALAFVMIVSHQVCAEPLAESTHLDLSMPSQSLVPSQSSVHRKDHWYKLVWGSMRKATRKNK